jgi:serine protease
MMNVMKNGLLLTVFVLSSSAFGMKTSRLIVKFKNGGVIKSNFSSSSITSVKSRGDGVIVIHAKNREELENMLINYKNDKSVDYVEEDKIMKHFYEPGDESSLEDQQYKSQWHYFEPDGGVNLPAAWDITRGSRSTVIAVIDTGITKHSDLNDKVIAGADLISDPFFANDGGGRDHDPSDPGDWVQFGDLCYQGFATDSSWHGTHTAGTIAASTGNGIGVAGVNWNALILPVRVLGKCGGYESDIADGIRWAVGESVPGLVNNPNPAKILNLSLGGIGGCSNTMQSAIDTANKSGAVVIVASGNDNTNLNYQAYSPANCRGVLVVAANNRDGSRSYYSNYGSKVDLAAPGGDHLGSILSTHNGGTHNPSFESYTSMSGTSMSAPHVAGIASLMVAVTPGLYPEQIREILRTTTQPFPWGSSCNRSICGSGIVDAYQAVVEASTTAPDPNYVGNNHPPIAGISGQQQIFKANSDDGGIGCGTIVYDDGGSNGPRGGIPVLFFALCLLAVKLTGKRNKN